MKASFLYFASLFNERTKKAVHMHFNKFYTVCIKQLTKIHRPRPFKSINYRCNLRKWNIFSFETSIKAELRSKIDHFTRNLHNFVCDVTDACHGTFRFRVKTDSQINVS